MASIWAKLAGGAVIAGAVGLGVFMWVTAAQRQPPSHWANLGEPNLTNGETLFWAGGCASCHAAPDATGDALKTLSGGQALPSPFGTFHMPNISSDPQHGIGAWTVGQFGDAMTRGVGKDGEHLYPSFPYNSYARMTPQDVNDLFAYLKTLPASTNDAPGHELPFPFNIRLALGGWKFLYFDKGKPRVQLANADAEVLRGQYLVEGLGHCGECHTPRDALGGFLKNQWLAGGPNPEGEGRIPDIRPESQPIGSWSQADIANYLETGFTPDFDSAGGSMVKVQQNMAHLPAEDRNAIAAYLKALPSP